MAEKEPASGSITIGGYVIGIDGDHYTILKINDDGSMTVFEEGKVIQLLLFSPDSVMANHTRQ